MKENLTEELDSTDVFNKWLNYLEADGFDRYSRASRAPQIEVLAEMLIEFKVDFESAKWLKTKVVQALMTERGYKKKDKHSNGNWLRNTEMDFDRIIADYYIQDPAKTETQYAKEYTQIPEVVEWAVEKFGKNIPRQALKDCHTIGNMLYFEYVEDFRRKERC